ncbi:MAG: penicillin-binding protein activator [Rhodospirillaceae bacterium]|nr:penicillin-binding protein activator [Rhodospirillaceae bacterium]
MRRIPVPTSNLYRSVTERLVRFTARAFAILVTTAFVVAETNNSFADPIDPRALLAQNVVPSVETPAATAVPDVRLSPFASPTRNTKVALLLPLSGPQAALGQAMLEAAQLAMFEMATDQFTLHPIDTRGTPEGARSAADQAIQDGVSLILGPLLANSVRSVAPVAGRVGLNVVAFSNSSDVAGHNVFIMGFVPRQQVYTVVDYAARRGLRRLALMAPDNPYGKAVFQSLQNVAASRGVEIVKFAFYRPGATDFSTEIKAISNYDERRKALLKQRALLEDREDEVSKQALKRLENLDTIGEVDFDAILLPDTGPSMSVLAAQLAFFDVDQPAVRFLGLRNWDQIPNLEREPSLRRAWFAAPSMKERRFFVERFSQTFGKPPPRLVSLAYDATALAAVLARSPGGPDFSRRALTNPNGFDGVDGLFRLREDGVAERAFAVLEVRKKGFRTLNRSARTFQDFHR